MANRFDIRADLFDTIPLFPFQPPEITAQQKIMLQRLHILVEGSRPLLDII